MSRTQRILGLLSPSRRREYRYRARANQREVGASCRDWWKRQGRSHIDDARTNVFLNLAVETLHSFVGAIAHGVEQRFSFSFASLNVFAGAESGPEDFECRHAPVAILAWMKTLRNNEAEAFGHAGADCGSDRRAEIRRRFARWSWTRRWYAESSKRDGRFRRLRGNFDGFAVSHFTYQNQLRRLAQGGAQERERTDGVSV